MGGNGWEWVGMGGDGCVEDGWKIDGSECGMGGK